ncbi:ALKBH8 [Scenedesmus sp. PABB004]|nr:ALKBH8 [Scenedesmus sp. PABB004]
MLPPGALLGARSPSAILAAAWRAALLPGAAAACAGRRRESSSAGAAELPAVSLPPYIVLLRHGESAGLEQLQEQLQIPNHRIPLSSRGVAQSLAAGRAIRQLLERDGGGGGGRLFLYTSPFLRCIQTAQQVARALDDDQLLGYQEEVQLREQDWGNFQAPGQQARGLGGVALPRGAGRGRGACVGAAERPRRRAAAAPLSVSRQARNYEERLKYGRFFFRFPDGESAADVFDRMTIFQDHFVRDAAAARFGGASVLLVTHGLAMRLFLMRFLHWTVDEFLQVHNPPTAAPVVLARTCPRLPPAGAGAGAAGGGAVAREAVKACYALTPESLALLRGVSPAMARGRGMAGARELLAWRPYTRQVPPPPAMDPEAEARLLELMEVGYGGGGPPGSGGGGGSMEGVAGVAAGSGGSASGPSSADGGAASLGEWSGSEAASEEDGGEEELLASAALGSSVKRDGGGERGESAAAGHQHKRARAGSAGSGREPKRQRGGKAHEVLVQPDGSRQVVMRQVLRTASMKVHLPLRFAAAAFPDQPCEVQVDVMVDGAAPGGSAAAVTGRLATYTRKQGYSDCTLTGVTPLLSRFAGHTLTCLVAAAGGQLTLRLVSPATQVAALAAAAEDITRSGWHTHECRGQGKKVVEASKVGRQLVLPVQLFAAAFPGQALPLEGVQLEVHKDGVALAGDPGERLVDVDEKRRVFVIPPSLGRAAAGCEVVRLKAAAAPNRLQVHVHSPAAGQAAGIGEAGTSAAAAALVGTCPSAAQTPERGARQPGRSAQRQRTAPGRSTARAASRQAASGGAALGASRLVPTTPAQLQIAAAAAAAFGQPGGSGGAESAVTDAADGSAQRQQQGAPAGQLQLAVVQAGVSHQLAAGGSAGGLPLALAPFASTQQAWEQLIELLDALPPPGALDLLLRVQAGMDALCGLQPSDARVAGLRSRYALLAALVRAGGDAGVLRRALDGLLREEGVAGVAAGSGGSASGPSSADGGAASLGEWSGSEAASEEDGGEEELLASAALGSSVKRDGGGERGESAAAGHQHKRARAGSAGSGREPKRQRGGKAHEVLVQPDGSRQVETRQVLKNTSMNLPLRFAAAAFPDQPCEVQVDVMVDGAATGGGAASARGRLATYTRKRGGARCTLSGVTSLLSPLAGHTLTCLVAAAGSGQLTLHLASPAAHQAAQAAATAEVARSGWHTHECRGQGKKVVEASKVGRQLVLPVQLFAAAFPGQALPLEGVQLEVHKDGVALAGDPGERLVDVDEKRRVFVIPPSLGRAAAGCEVVRLKAAAAPNRLQVHVHSPAAGQAAGIGEAGTSAAAAALVGTCPSAAQTPERGARQPGRSAQRQRTAPGRSTARAASRQAASGGAALGASRLVPTTPAQLQIAAAAAAAFGQPGQQHGGSGGAESAVTAAADVSASAQQGAPAGQLRLAVVPAPGAEHQLAHAASGRVGGLPPALAPFASTQQAWEQLIELLDALPPPGALDLLLRVQAGMDALCGLQPSDARVAGLRSRYALLAALVRAGGDEGVLRRALDGLLREGQGKKVVEASKVGRQLVLPVQLFAAAFPGQALPLEGVQLEVHKDGVALAGDPSERNTVTVGKGNRIYTIPPSLGRAAAGCEVVRLKAAAAPNRLQVHVHSPAAGQAAGVGEAGTSAAAAALVGTCPSAAQTPERGARQPGRSAQRQRTAPGRSTARAASRQAASGGAALGASRLVPTTPAQLQIAAAAAAAFGQPGQQHGGSGGAESAVTAAADVSASAQQGAPAGQLRLAVVPAPGAEHQLAHAASGRVGGLPPALAPFASTQQAWEQLIELLDALPPPGALDLLLRVQAGMDALCGLQPSDARVAGLRSRYALLAALVRAGGDEGVLRRALDGLLREVSGDGVGPALNFRRPADPSAVTRHLCVANAGAGCEAALRAALQPFAAADCAAPEVRAPSDGRPVLYASFSSPAEAAAARAALGGRPVPWLPGRAFSIKHAELVAPKPQTHVQPLLPVALTAADAGVPGLSLHASFVSAEEEARLLAAVDEQPWAPLSKRRVQHHGFAFSYADRGVDPGAPLGALPPWAAALAARLQVRRRRRRPHRAGPGVVAHAAWRRRPYAVRRSRAAAAQALPEVGQALDQLTVNEYAPGVGLSAHIDTHSAFTGAIASLSLAGGCVMEFRRGSGCAAAQAEQQQQQQPEQQQQQQLEKQQQQPEEERVAIYLPRRSLLVMAGEARLGWRHAIPHRKSDVVDDQQLPRAARRVSLTFRKVRGFPCDCAFPDCCDSQACALPPTRISQLRRGGEGGAAALSPAQPAGAQPHQPLRRPLLCAPLENRRPAMACATPPAAPTASRIGKGHATPAAATPGSPGAGGGGAAAAAAAGAGPDAAGVGAQAPLPQQSGHDAVTPVFNISSAAPPPSAPSKWKGAASAGGAPVYQLAGRGSARPSAAGAGAPAATPPGALAGRGGAAGAPAKTHGTLARTGARAAASAALSLRGGPRATPPPPCGGSAFGSRIATGRLAAAAGGAPCAGGAGTPSCITPPLDGSAGKSVARVLSFDDTARQTGAGSAAGGGAQRPPGAAGAAAARPREPEAGGAGRPAGARGKEQAGGAGADDVARQLDQQLAAAADDDDDRGAWSAGGGGRSSSPAREAPAPKPAATDPAGAEGGSDGAGAVAAVAAPRARRAGSLGGLLLLAWSGLMLAAGFLAAAVLTVLQAPGLLGASWDGGDDAGVPGLFAFLRRRSPQICRPVDGRSAARDAAAGGDGGDGGVDNLYIDANHVIHSCTHAHVAKDRPELSEAETFGGMAAYLEALLDAVQPRRLVFIAVDGVAPRAKMNQQRTRRFLSAYVGGVTDRVERDVRREMVADAGGALEVPQAKRFDSNIITPGTEFMLLLARWLHKWAADKVARDARFASTTFLVSDASEPGEGEHKIMRLLRHLKAQPGYDPNTRHVVYGQDADLLLLALLCHEPHFRVMREDMMAGDAAASGRESRAAAEQAAALRRPLSAVAAALQDQAGGGGALGAVLPDLAAAAAAAAGHILAVSDHLQMPVFEAVDIGLLRECLQWEFSDLVGRPGPLGTYGSDEESGDDESGSGSGSGGGWGAVDAEPDGGAPDPDSFAAAAGPPAAPEGRRPRRAARTRRAARDGASSDDGAGSPAPATPPGTVQGVTAPNGGGGGSSSSSSSPADAGGGGAAAAAADTPRPPRQRGKPGLSFEQLLDDLVVLSFFAGNDFLPNVPSIDIYDRPSGLDLLWAAYKALAPKLGGHLTSGGAVNRGRLVQLLVFLSRDEEPAFRRRAENRRRRAAQRRAEEAAAHSAFDGLFAGGLSMGELPPGVDVDALLAGTDPALAAALGLPCDDGPPAVDLRALGPGELLVELAGRVGARVQERLMGGDPWAQDPVGMELPGFRARYYTARFPDLLEDLGGDVDRVAARVSADYLQGVDWVFRYYACGPATLQWQSAAGGAGGGGPGGGIAGAGAGAPDGASWTWCYPHHYAPLIQDLAKTKLWSKAGPAAKGVCVAPIPLHRGLVDPHACELDEWAPPGGPVRPLLQLMCVLPAKSVGDALPTALANLVVLAESIEEDEAAAGAAARARRAALLGPGGHAAARRGRAARKAARRARRDAAAARLTGLSGLDVLAALGEEEPAADLGVDSSASDDDEAGASGDGDGPGAASPRGAGAAAAASPRGGGAVAAAGAAPRALGFELSGDADLDLMRLAQELAATFPGDVERLVDLTGKKWLHTGVVRLPMAQPQHVAAVLQAALSLQPGADALSEAELARNAFRPAPVLATAAAAERAGADAPGAPSMLAADGFVFVMKATGVMKRCEEGKPESCTVFNTLGCQKYNPGKSPCIGGGPMMYLRQGFIIATSANDMVVCSTTSANSCKLINQCNRNSIYTSLLLANNRIYAGLSSQGRGEGGVMWSCDAGRGGSDPLPNSCIRLNKAADKNDIFSFAYGDGVLWAGLDEGQIWKCDPNTPDSCQRFNKAGSTIYSLLLANGVLFAGLGGGQMWKCRLDQPDSCDRWNKFEISVRQLIQMPNDASNIYAMAGWGVYRCPVATPDSCTYIATVSTRNPSPGVAVGLSAVDGTTIYAGWEGVVGRVLVTRTCAQYYFNEKTYWVHGAPIVCSPGSKFNPSQASNPNPSQQTCCSDDVDVSIAKSGPTDPQLVGTEFDFTLTVRVEKGSSGANDVNVTDALPAELVLVSAKPDKGNCSSSGATITCNIGAMSLAETVFVIVRVKGTAAGSWTNVATVNATGDTNPSNDQANSTVQLSVALQKTGPATDQIVGEAFNFALRVWIVSGTKGATSVVLVDTLPTGLELVEVKPDTGCTVDYPSISCELGPMLLGESKVVTVTAKAARVGTFDNAAAVSATDGSTVTLATSSASVTVVRDNDADMSIAKSVSSPSVLISGQVNYTITATNVGAGTATGVIVNDTLPAGLAFATPLPAGCSQRAQVLTCGPSSVAAGDKLTYLVPVKAVAVGSWNNSARVSADNDVNPYNNGPVVAPVTVTRTCAQYYADGSRYACSPGSKYNPSQASNPNPSQQACCTDCKTCYDFPDLCGSYDNGCGTIITCTCPPDKPYCHQTDLLRGNSDPGFCSDNPFVPSRDLDVSIAKSGPTDPQLVGTEFDFTLSVRVEKGSSGANDVNVTDALPPGLVLVSAKPDKGNCSSSGATITCNIGAMSLAETVFVSVRVKGTAAGSWTNVATVNATGDTNPSNDQANSTVQVACLSCTTYAELCGTFSDGCGGTINCTCPASAPYCHQTTKLLRAGLSGHCSDQPINPTNLTDVAIYKTGPGYDPVQGQEFNFLLTVRVVDGLAGAKNVVVKDTLPAGLELVAVIPDTGCTVQFPLITCPLGSMSRAETRYVNIRVKGNGVGTYTNQAEVSATNDRNPGNNKSNATVTIIQSTPSKGSDMSIAKSVSSPSVLISGQVNYTITATNVGAGTATGVIVNDTLPAGLAFATPLPAGCSQRAQVLTCGPSSVAAGDKLTYLVPVKAVAVGSWNNSARVSADNDVNPYNNGPVVAPVTVTRTCAQYYADGSRYACSPGSKYNPSQASNPNPSQQACCTDCKTCYDFPDLCGSYDNGCGTIITCTCPPDKPYCHQTDLLRGNSDPGFCSDNPFVPSRDLDVSIAKSGPTDPQLVGTEFDFTLSVRVEKGSSGANDVNVTDALPPGLVLVSAKPDKGSCSSSGATITCNIGAMSLAETVFVSVRVKGTAAGSWTNVATVNATGDTNPSNDQANSTVQVACLSCTSSYVGLCGTFTDGCGGFITCTCPLSKPVCNKLPGAPSGVCADRPIDPTALADISITETGPTTTQVIGQVFDFKLTATVVDGLDGAKNVVITDRLPGGLELVAVRPDTGCTIRYPVITCAVGDLAFAGTYSLAVTVKAARAGSFNNRASANATNDRNQGNNKAEARVTVVGGACCTSSGRCLVVSESACVDGVYNPGQNCGSVTCARKPTIGACCVGQDCRNNYTLNACTQDAGNFYANQTCNSKTCGSDPPVAPRGACCQPAQSKCTPNATAAWCQAQGGQWAKDEACTVAACPAAIGACCVGQDCRNNYTLNACTQDAGNFYANQTCNSKTCGSDPPVAPRGACCQPAQSKCTPNATAAWCQAQGGQWAKDEACTVAACPAAIGACCLASGACAEGTARVCRADDGTWNRGLTCSQVACPILPAATGACCDSIARKCTAPVRESACVNGTWTQNANCTVDVCPAAFCVPTWRMCEPCTLPGCNPCCDSTSACKPVYGIHTSWYACKPGEGCRPEGQPCGECSGGGVCCDGLTCKWDHYGKRGVCTKPFACKQIGEACAAPRDCCPGSTCGTDGKCRPCDCKRKCRKHDQRCAAQREAECRMLSAAVASAVLTGPSGALIQVGGR